MTTATTAPRTRSTTPRARRPRRPSVEVRLSGDLDLSAAPGLADHVLALVDGGADVVLDVSAVAFVDCCGLTALERCLVLGGDRVRLSRSGDAVDGLARLVAGPASPLRRSATGPVAA
ncbi:STAS domain-containing protein [Pseudokineococcus sp. 5B2Z-1]|uniref:STAS domain-containing protein n=1 Tax=Pseudokineococcus sp. 5B2Z-1 TaxID=3132744 RepID=UPI003098B213